MSDSQSNSGGKACDTEEIIIQISLDVFRICKRTALLEVMVGSHTLWDWNSMTSLHGSVCFGSHREIRTFITQIFHCSCRDWITAELL